MYPCPSVLLHQAMEDISEVTMRASQVVCLLQQSLYEQGCLLIIANSTVVPYTFGSLTLIW